MNETLIATKPFTYAGKWLAAGDSFFASRQDGRALRALKMAKFPDPTPDPVSEPDPKMPSAEALSEDEGGKAALTNDTPIARKRAKKAN
ncbi:hypothetical protein KVP10_08515 [Candidimonas humi]|uniref:Uncharacterized protein n=1 Tax=Candidimonas humi TaxID=683355 RepID=A0ABV8NXR0_9BURK|nr:hypothetical protein [Candidimonas humi]MBV6304929.1 hypothetical protein [Candidimonas humi]